jgi:hypothetical protein
MRGRRRAVAERDLWPSRSPELSPPYLLLCRDLKDQACAAPSMATDDSVAIIEYIIACWILWYVVHYSVLDTMICGTLLSALKQMTTAPKTYCNYKATIEWSSDDMRYWAVTFQKLHISGHILCNSCDFVTRNHTLEGGWKNFVAPYTQAKEGTNLTNKFEGRRLVTFFFFFFFFFFFLFCVFVCDFFCG